MSLWPTSVITTRTCAGSTVNAPIPPRFQTTAAAAYGRHVPSYASRVPLKEKKIAAVVQSAQENEYERRRRALERPFATTEIKQPPPSSAKPKTGVLRVRWMDSNDFVGMVTCPQASTCASLRRQLLAEGVVKSDNFKFVVKGAPLNALQEAMCTISLFPDSVAELAPRHVALSPSANAARMAASRGDATLVGPTKCSKRGGVLSPSLRAQLGRLPPGGSELLLSALRAHDKDGSGSLSAREFGNVVFSVFGDRLPRQDLRALVDALDTDGDGEISLAELSTFAAARQRQASASADAACEKLRAALARAHGGGIVRRLRLVELRDEPNDGDGGGVPCSAAAAPAAPASAALRRAQRHVADASAQQRILAARTRWRRGERAYHPKSGVEGVVEAVEGDTCLLRVAPSVRAVRAVFERLDLDFSGDLASCALDVVQYPRINPLQCGAAVLLSPRLRAVQADSLHFRDQQDEREMRRACGTLGALLSSSELRAVYARFATHGGRVNYRSLLHFCFPELGESVDDLAEKLRKRLLLSSFGGTKLRAAFNAFDPSGEATGVSLASFRKGLAALGLGLSDQDVHRVANRLDPNGDNVVSFAEFAAFLEERSARWMPIAALCGRLRRVVRDAQLRAQREAATAGAAGGGGAATPPPPRVYEVDAAASLASLDCNKDGRVSKADFDAAVCALLPELELHTADLQRLRDAIDPRLGTSDALRVESWAEFLEAARPSEGDVESLSERFRAKVQRALWHDDGLGCGEGFRRVFMRFDPLGTGQISVRDFRAAASELGLAMNEEEAERVLALKFETVAGRVRFRSFIKWACPRGARSVDDVTAKLRSALRRRSFGGVQLRRIFRTLDEDGKGAVNSTCFRAALGKLGLARGELTDVEVERLLEHLDVDGDGKIDYNEFVKFVLQTGEDVAHLPARAAPVVAVVAAVPAPAAVTKPQHGAAKAAGRRQVNSYLSTARFY